MLNLINETEINNFLGKMKAELRTGTMLSAYLRQINILQPKEE